MFLRLPELPDFTVENAGTYPTTPPRSPSPITDPFLLIDPIYDQYFLPPSRELEPSSPLIPFNDLSAPIEVEQVVSPQPTLVDASPTTPTAALFFPPETCKRPFPRLGPSAQEEPSKRKRPRQVGPPGSARLDLRPPRPPPGDFVCKCSPDELPPSKRMDHHYKYCRFNPNRELWRCLVQGCDKTYPTKWNRDRHKAVHKIAASAIPAFPS